MAESPNARPMFALGVIALIVLILAGPKVASIGRQQSASTLALATRLRQSTFALMAIRRTFWLPTTCTCLRICESIGPARRSTAPTNPPTSPPSSA